MITVYDGTIRIVWASRQSYSVVVERGGGARGARFTTKLISWQIRRCPMVMTLDINTLEYRRIVQQSVYIVIIECSSGEPITSVRTKTVVVNYEHNVYTYILFPVYYTHCLAYVRPIYRSPIIYVYLIIVYRLIGGGHTREAECIDTRH